MKSLAPLARAIDGPGDFLTCPALLHQGCRWHLHRGIDRLSQEIPVRGRRLHDPFLGMIFPFGSP
jgi:hypothetical protein